MKPSIAQITETLRSSEATYQPNSSIRRILGEHTFIAIIGPAFVGKSTIMAAIETQDARFRRIISFKTRPAREGESATDSISIGHTLASLSTINDKRLGGELVQYIVHPTTGHIYGSDIAAYQAPFNVLDTLPGALPAIGKLPFKRIDKISLVTTPEHFDYFLRSRPTMPEPKDLHDRFLEGRDNIAWSLNNPDTKWVINEPGKQQAAAEKIIDLALHPDRLQPAHELASGRAAAEGLHAYFNYMLDRTP